MKELQATPFKKKLYPLNTPKEEKGNHHGKRLREFGHPTGILEPPTQKRKDKGLTDMEDEENNEEYVPEDYYMSDEENISPNHQPTRDKTEDENQHLPEGQAESFIHLGQIKSGNQMIDLKIRKIKEPYDEIVPVNRSKKHDEFCLAFMKWKQTRKEKSCSTQIKALIDAVKNETETLDKVLIDYASSKSSGSIRSIIARYTSHEAYCKLTRLETNILYALKEANSSIKIYPEEIRNNLKSKYPIRLELMMEAKTAMGNKKHNKKFNSSKEKKIYDAKNNAKRSEALAKHRSNAPLIEDEIRRVKSVYKNNAKNNAKTSEALAKHRSNAPLTEDEIRRVKSVKKNSPKNNAKNNPKNNAKKKNERAKLTYVEKKIITHELMCFYYKQCHERMSIKEISNLILSELNNNNGNYNFIIPLLKFLETSIDKSKRSASLQILRERAHQFKKRYKHSRKEIEYPEFTPEEALVIASNICNTFFEDLNFQDLYNIPCMYIGQSGMADHTIESFNTILREQSKMINETNVSYSRIMKLGIDGLERIKRKEAIETLDFQVYKLFQHNNQDLIRNVEANIQEKLMESIPFGRILNLKAHGGGKTGNKNFRNEYYVYITFSNSIHELVLDNKIFICRNVYDYQYCNKHHQNVPEIVDTFEEYNKFKIRFDSTFVKDYNEHYKMKWVYLKNFEDIQVKVETFSSQGSMLSIPPTSPLLSINDDILEHVDSPLLTNTRSRDNSLNNSLQQFAPLKRKRI